jgi:hypothetical protein
MENNPKIVLELTIEQVELIISNSNHRISNNGIWYYIPYAFRYIGGNSVELVPLARVPKDVSDVLKYPSEEELSDLENQK